MPLTHPYTKRVEDAGIPADNMDAAITELQTLLRPTRGSHRADQLPRSSEARHHENGHRKQSHGHIAQSAGDTCTLPDRRRATRPIQRNLYELAQPPGIAPHHVAR